MCWCGSKVKCDLCAHMWVAVFHSESERLECPNCENMAYYEVLPIDWGIKNDANSL